MISNKVKHSLIICMDPRLMSGQYKSSCTRMFTVNLFMQPQTEKRTQMSTDRRKGKQKYSGIFIT
jgi:hypothetical protein